MPHCWGFNAHSQLGRPASASSNFATPVAPNLLGGASVTDFKHIQTGGYYTCAKTNANDTYCWGSNTYGESGKPTGSGTSIPAYNLTSQLPTYDKADIGYTENCVIGNTGADLGKVRCWGFNDTNGSYKNKGSLGFILPTQSALPLAPVPNVIDAKEVATGYYSCAIVGNAGKVICWGHASVNWGHGVFGAGNVNNSNSLDPNIPMFYVKTAPNVDLTGAKKIAVYGARACIINTSSAMYCWGLNSTYGAITGEGTTGLVNYAWPMPAPFNSNISKMALGSTHTCVLKLGNVHCVGRDDQGVLGNGLTSTGAYQNHAQSMTPVVGLAAGAITDITATSQLTCALDGATKNVWCWGRNNEGQLGDCTTTNYGKSTPVQVMTSCGVTPPPPPACGTAVSSGPYNAAPTANLCSPGTANTPALAGGNYNWTCASGSTVSCQAPATLPPQNDNGVCNASTMGGTFPTPGPSATPPTNLCTLGTPTAVTQQTVSPYNWLWSCQGLGAGTTAACFARSVPVPSNGACGSGNGNPPDASIAAIPQPYCASGTASPSQPVLNNAGNWAAWSCVGANGGNTVQCGTKILAPAPKVVTPSAGTGCNITPNTPQTVNTGSTASFTITPSAGYKLSLTAGTCGGAMTSGIFTTNPVNNNCTVIANCSLCGKSDVIKGLCGSVIIHDKLN